MKVMIVDDEPVARQRLIRLLKDIPNTSVVAEAGDARDALALLPSHAPDLILLDVEMPGVDGLTLAALPTLPAVIFVTAHADRALQAFEVGAHDYLIKPVNLARLTAAIDKVRARQPASGHAAPDEWWRLTVTEGTLRRFIDAREVACFSATDKYVSFQAQGRELLLRESLDALEARLGPHGFLRAHRGALVRRGAIEAFDQSEGGTLVLICGERIPVSRRALPQVRAALGLTP
jgi:DNA-binding LytR/AlgR family response regulator